MQKLSKEEFDALIKKERNNRFCTPFDQIYTTYEKLGILEKNKRFFLENASDIVETVRRISWQNFKPLEQEFVSDMLKELIDENIIKNMNATEAIEWFVSTYPEHIYSLSLSNTQSRRSRAGKEFEAIIEILLTGAKISYESQGNVGKKQFVDKDLGKLVDLVLPNSNAYKIRKYDCILISAKTTLRERWQEVPEEMGRTGAGTMYLATLDENISSDIIETLYEANIQLVSTKNIKESCYKKQNNVITFEELLQNGLHNSSKWETFSFNDTEKFEISKSLKKSIIKHENHDFIKNFFADELKKQK